MKKQVTIISAFLILACPFMRAQDISVRAVLDTNKALIGDQLKLRLVVQQSESGWKVDFPSIADTLTRYIEVVNIRPVDTSLSGNGKMLTQDLLITVFDTGFFEIPALPFAINHGEWTDTISTLPVSFAVLSMEADSTIRDIKAIYKMPVGFREAAPYVLAVTVSGLLAWVLIRYLKNRKNRKKSTPGKVITVPSEPPDVIALRELGQLRDEKPWMNNRVKYYYSRISEILRTYIERRYNTLAMEQTTGEILQSLDRQTIDSHELNRLSDMLRLADLVKFAKVIPDIGENAAQVGRAIDFVKNTSALTAIEAGSEAVAESNRA